MARARNPEIVKRNDKMYADWRRGASITSLAAEAGIARQVAARIIAAYHPEDDEDSERGVFRGELWRLHDEVADIFRNPGFKMAPNGRPAEGFDGEPALDTNVQVQAGELRLKVLKELRILDARDRPAQQNVKHSFEFYQAEKDASIAALRAKREAEQRELEELRRLRAVVPGEVLELPPGT